MTCQFTFLIEVCENSSKRNVFFGLSTWSVLVQLWIFFSLLMAAAFGLRHQLIPCFSAWCLWGRSQCGRWGGRWTQPGQRGPAWWRRLQTDPRARKTEDAPQTSRRGTRVPLKQHIDRQTKATTYLSSQTDTHGGRKCVVLPVICNISSSRSVTASSCITWPPMMNSSRPSFTSCRT